MKTAVDSKDLIISARENAAIHMGRIKSAPCLTFELLHKELSGFIKSKFMLAEEDCTTDNFDELTNISMSKSMKISKELVAQFDLAKSCDGVSSVMAKKVLLFMAIQRELNITLPADETANVITLHDISKMVYTAIETQK